MKKTRTITSIIIVLGLCMFLLAISLFSYSGQVSPLLHELGKWSFILWFPVMLIGAILRLVLKND